MRGAVDSAKKKERAPCRCCEHKKKCKSWSVITDINVTGKKIVVPVLISVESRADNNRIDAHLVLTVYDSKDWIGDFSEPAVKVEKSGNPGVFYTNPEKAEKYSALSLGKKGTILSGFTGHTIQDIGINVKPQMGALQFYPGSGMPKLWRDAAAVAVEAW